MYCLPALINYLIVALMHFTNTITLGSVEYVLNKWYVDMSLHISIIYDWNVNRTYPLKTLSILFTLHLGWHFKSNLIPESCFYFILFLLPGLFFQQIVKQNNKKIIKILYIYIYIDIDILPAVYYFLNSLQLAMEKLVLFKLVNFIYPYS